MKKNEKMQKNKPAWSREMTKTLIELVRQSPVLWDVNFKDHKDRSKRNNALRIIGVKLGVPALEVKRKILKLRTQYSNEKNKMRKSKLTAEKYVTKWQYFSLLNFLFQHENFNSSNNIQGRPKITKISPVSSSISIKKEKILSQSEDPMPMPTSTGSFEIGLPIASETPFNIQATQNTATDADVDVEKLEVVNNNKCVPVTKKKQSSDEFTIFGDFVSSEMRSIRNPDLQSKLRRQIMRLIVDAADEDALLCSSSYESPNSRFSSQSSRLVLLQSNARNQSPSPDFTSSMTDSKDSVFLNDVYTIN